MAFRGIADDTPILPWIVADTVIEEVNSCFPGHLGSGRRLADKLSKRADAIYKANPQFRKLIKSHGNKGRDALYGFMRHWLTAELKESNPALFNKLPRSFWTGTPLRCGRGR